MSNMPVIDQCAAVDCSYNHDGCNAYAMNMGTKGCTTFISLDARGGLPTVKAQVGACQKADCSYNESLECHAELVKVGAGECLTYHRVA